VLVSPGNSAGFHPHAWRKVSDVMTPEVTCVGSNTSLEEVVEVMEKQRIKRVAVQENGHMVGVVARSDLLRALLSRSGKSSRRQHLRTIGHPGVDPRHSGGRVVGADDDVERDRGERCGGRLGHHHQPGRTARDLRDRGERPGCEGGARSSGVCEPYTGTVIESPDDTK